MLKTKKFKRQKEGKLRKGKRYEIKFTYPVFMEKFLKMKIKLLLFPRKTQSAAKAESAQKFYN